MSADPLKSLGYWSGKEIALEGALPIGIAGYAFWKISGLMGDPAMGKPLTQLETFVLLGALVALISWAVSRQMFLLGRRKPVLIAFFTLLFTLGTVLGVSASVVSSFEQTCSDLGGKIVYSLPFLGDALEKARSMGNATLAGDKVCQIGGIPGNTYVPGTLIRPQWNGIVSPILWGFLIVVSTLAGVSLRDRRIFPSKIVVDLYKLLEYAPATGLAGALGEKPKDGKVQACTNPTFWGEICGQVYSAERKFEPGEWCGRCNQVYQKAERELTFNVVSLFTDNIDLLNMLEKKDTLSWDVPGRIPADGRQSGVERWVVLGKVTIPDVLSVSQLLSIAHELLPSWTSDDERTKSAIDLAKKRSSKLYGWIWFGRQNKRLTYARPTNKVLMAVGTTRLRDLITDSGDELYLQLDIGLLPVEMRTAFLRTFLDESRNARFQNSKYDLWVPVAPKLTDELAGLWVPRIEGNAFRKWLSTGRLQEDGKRGVTVPRPYQVYIEPTLDEEDTSNVDLMDLGGDVLPGQNSDLHTDLEDAKNETQIKSESTGLEWEDVNSEVQGDGNVQVSDEAEEINLFGEENKVEEEQEQEESGLDITDIFDFGPEEEEEAGWGDDWGQGWESTEQGKEQGKEQGTGNQQGNQQESMDQISNQAEKEMSEQSASTAQISSQSESKDKPKSTSDEQIPAQKNSSSKGGELKGSEPTPVIDFSEFKVPPGTLDFVRVPLNNVQTEPRMDGIQTGASISEWEWFEPEQIQLLRQQCLVLVDSRKI